MKRSPFLRDLSRDHHTALSLANRIAKAEDGALATLARDVAKSFDLDLEPHFRREEEDLLVKLSAAGEAPLVRRTLADHGRLRELASRLAGGDASVLKGFGRELHDHVRFEERELFPVAEALLGGAPKAE